MCRQKCSLGWRGEFRRFIHYQLDGSVSAQGFGIRAGFVRLFHDALSLDAIQARELRMQIHRQAVATVLILNQAHQCPHREIRDRGAELFGRAAQGTVVTGGIRTRKQQFGTGAAFLEAFHQWISQGDIQQPVRCVKGSRTSTQGNRFGSKQSLHVSFVFTLPDDPVFRYGVNPYRNYAASCFEIIIDVHGKAETKRRNSVFKPDVSPGLDDADAVRCER